MEFGNSKRLRCLQVLNLPSRASNEEIKKAYKSMALQYHPDKNPSPDANTKFQEISAAYNYLLEGDDFLDRLKEEDLNAFDFIFTHLFSWFTRPTTPFAGPQYFYEEDDSDSADDDDDYYGYEYMPSYTFNQSKDSGRSSSWQRSEPSYHSPSASRFETRATSPSASASPRDFNFTYANNQHGQYFQETRQSRQNAKSSKRINKEARNARKDYKEQCSSTSRSPEQPKSQYSRNNQDCATSPPYFRKVHAEARSSAGQNNERVSSPGACRYSSSPGRTPERDSTNGMKPENQPTKKSKRKLRCEQKQKDQEMSDIRQQLEKEEEKKKRKAEERRIAQEQKEKAEREAREKERKEEEERLKAFREADEKRKEEERKRLAKENADKKRRADLMKQFDSNEFLSDDGDFRSKSSDLLNIIKSDLHLDSSKEDCEKVENINGIPIADLARLQLKNLPGHSDKAGKKSAKERSPENVSADRQPDGRRTRNRQNETQQNYNYKNGQRPTFHASTTYSTNHSWGSARTQYQRQQQPWSNQQFQGQRQPASNFNGSFNNMQQPHPRMPQSQGPTMSPTVPPPQLNRPPPPLRFVRPVFPRQAMPNYSPAQGFPNSQFMRTKAT